MLRHASAFEIAVVLAPPIVLSIASAILWHLQRPGPIPFNDRNVVASLALQVVIAGCLLPYLFRKKWKPLEVAGAPEIGDFVAGLGVWLGLLAFVYATVLALYVVAPGFVAPLRAGPFTGSLSPLVIASGAILDPIFEEFLLLCYTVRALGYRFGIKAAGV